MKTFQQFTESILDPLQTTLARDVFINGHSPKLRPAIKDAIEAGVEEISKLSPVVEYCLIGSSVTHRYTEGADLDINVLVDPNTDDATYDRLIVLNKELSNNYAPGTTHPINYYIIVDKKQYDLANKNADGQFDVKNNKFLRRAKESPFELDSYMDEFHKKVKKIDWEERELKADLMDYEDIKSLSTKDIMGVHSNLREVLRKVEVDARKLVDTYDKIHADRAEIFGRPLTPAEIRKWGSKNRMPANVIYKLLERQLYLDVLVQIRKIVKDKTDLTDDDVKELESLLYDN